MKAAARKIGLSLALATAMTTGLSSSEAREPNIFPDSITAEQEAGYNIHFAAAQEYWSAQGVRGLEDTRVRYISGREIGYCMLESIRSGDTSTYCPTNKTIFMTAEDVTRSHPNSYAGLFFAAHEYGHRVQDATDKLLAVPPKTELGATCLAGKFMIERYPGIIIMSVTTDVLAGTDVTTVVGGDDYRHGTAKQQQQALAEGINSQDCTRYGLPF